MRLRALAASLLVLGTLPSPVAAQTAPRKYLAFGDSITFGVGDNPDRARLGYPPRLETMLQTAGVSATVLNLGVPGENTTVGVTRIDSVLPQGGPGDVLILMEGTNDISRNIGIETTIFDLQAMARKAENRNMRVIHATVIPRDPSARVDADNSLTDDLNGRIRDLAGTEQRGLADPNEVYRNTPDLYAVYYSPLEPDPVGHPNAAGFLLLAQVFFNVIQGIDTVSPVPGVITPSPGARNVRSDIPIEVDIWDFGAGIDLASTFLLVNGQVVTAAPIGNSRRAHLSYQSLAPLSGTVTLGLRSRDLATPPNTIDRVIGRFTILGSGSGSLQGDLNKDNRVDGTDLVLFGRSFGAQRGEAGYNTNADFNADNRVDGQDLAVLAANFGRTATAPS
ncbi:MAG TPA: GDSL-type esterase/lipase family protein [Thermoanaerobaculia bacterium]|nr:GDSL-type esterase/lipase family protein [Thermoanaerobaculia bacterium]